MSVCCVLLFAVGFILTACSAKPERQTRKHVTVSIAPLRYLVEALADTTIGVNVLTPEGASPETYQLTPGQLTAMNQSMAYIRVGSLGFERTQLNKITENMPHLVDVNVSRGIVMIKHRHDGDEMESNDPHVWMSPGTMRVMARNVFEMLADLDTLHRDFFASRFHIFTEHMDSLENAIRLKLFRAKTRSFLIYHPALAYYAKDFNLHQLSVQVDGKDPSAEYMARLIRQCRKEGVRVVFVQKEYSGKTARIIAKEIGARVVEINPLSSDWEGEIMRITDALCQ